MKQRLQKLLASAGVASRRKVEEMIRQGRVAVNGKIMVDLPILVENSDRVEVDGERIILGRRELAERIYLLLNKPKGVHSTTAAQGEQALAIDLLPPDLPVRVFPVGRLDAQSRGLLLFTNDGELTNHLTHPSFGVPKVYRASIDGFLSDESIAKLEKGIWIADPRSGKGIRTGRTQLRVLNRSRTGTILELTIVEGRNPQLRQMFAKAGHKVRELIRVAIGPLKLERLGPGEFRLLTPREVRELRSFSKKRKPRPMSRDAESE